MCADKLKRSDSLVLDRRSPTQSHVADWGGDQGALQDTAERSGGATHESAGLGEETGKGKIPPLHIAGWV